MINDQQTVILQEPDRPPDDEAGNVVPVQLSAALGVTWVVKTGNSPTETWEVDMQKMGI